MKKILVLLFFLPVFSFSQEKNVNTIAIPYATMEQTIKIFRDHGYMIGAAAYGIVTTIPQKSPNHITIVFEMEIKDSTGFLRGTYDGKPITPRLWQHSESYAGHYKGGSFKIMDSLAKSFGQPVTYLQK